MSTHTENTSVEAPGTWPLAEVSLKVLDLRNQVRFYESFGMQRMESSEDKAVFSAGKFLLTLRQLTNGRPRPAHAAGLFHLAILVPNRATLGAFLRHASQHRWNFIGAADHLVSEALYFSDPENNGIEVYVDRPKNEWKWNEGRIAMDTLPLDLHALGQEGTDRWNGFPAATRLGHIHLTVSHLDESQDFYESLGLKLTSNWGAFRFLSWDAYHHHVAINLVAGRNAAPVATDVAGLESFSIAREALGKARFDPGHVLLTPPQS